MPPFPIHTADTAPKSAHATLRAMEDKFGFVPNLAGVMASAPAVLNAYIGLSQGFEESSLDSALRQMVLLAVSRANGCTYCVAAHSLLAETTGLPAEAIQRLRDGQEQLDDQLEALVRFTTRVVTKRGFVSQADMDEFLGAGFTRAQMLEVVLGVAYKTLSNYVNHMAETPLDTQFEPGRWDARPGAEGEAA